MTTWGVGFIPFNMQAKLEHDGGLVVVIQEIWTTYAKALKGVWMERNWKSAFNKMVQHKEINLFTQYHDSEMVNMFLMMPYSILFEFHVLDLICNTYCIVLFVLRFETPWGKCLWLMLWMQH
jgi:hypothetical protein